MEAHQPFHSYVPIIETIIREFSHRQLDYTVKKRRKFAKQVKHNFNSLLCMLLFNIKNDNWQRSSSMDLTLTLIWECVEALKNYSNNNIKFVLNRLSHD